MNKQRTGVGEYAYELLDAVFKNADDNQYFLFYNSYKDVSDNIPKWNYENVHYLFTRWPNKLFSLFTWLGFIKLDRLIKQKVDWFFAPNINFLSLSRKTKFILTVHDLSFEILPECYTWKRRLWHKALRPKKMCRRADIILTPSENTRRDVMREWWIEGDKIKVLYPGLSSVIGYPSNSAGRQISDNNEPRSEEIKRKYGLPDKYILYLGTIEPRKNILGIIEAYKKSLLLNDKYMLVVAGASGWKNEEVLESLEKTTGVKYIGYVKDEDKAMLYKNADLFVFPSLYEGFGLPVLEALACGTPVITSDRSSLSEVFGDHATLVNPNNISEISRAMKVVLNSKIETPKIDLEKFDWGKVAEKFLDLTNT